MHVLRQKMLFARFLTRRFTKVTIPLRDEKMKYEEIKIPVPWGELAGKWWGSKNQRPILCIHGWQDNCGTFDTLIPLLPHNISFLAIDLPGHGLSSRLPPGIFYHNIPNTSILIRLLQKKFGWNKVSIMAHSLGAMISFVFASAYPQDVDFLVSFDFIKPLQNDRLPQVRGESIDAFLKYNAHLEGDQPDYTMEELTKLWHDGSLGSVDLNHCKYILERNTQPSKKTVGKFYLTRDPRLKVEPLFNYPHQELLECAEKLTMPVFATKGKEALYFEKKQLYYEVLEAIKKHSRDCRFYMVDGTHHHHLNNPESFSERLADFLVKYYTDHKL